MPGGVHVEAMGTEWDEVLSSIEGLDRETLAQAGQILAMIREKDMSPEQFAVWASEHQVTPEALSAALVIVGQDWRDDYPDLGEVASAACAALYELAGTELENIEEIPPTGRPCLAMYLGKRAEGQLALKALNSLTDDELVEMPRTLLYRASSHLMSDAPRTAITVLKRYGVVLHVERMLCHELMRTARYLGDTETVEGSLIPYAEAALKQMPPTDFWEQAVIALVWGYAFCGQDYAAAAAGGEWLAKAEAFGCDPRGAPALQVKVYLAPPLARIGRSSDAVELLRDVLTYAPPSSALAAKAQANLMGILRNSATRRAHNGGA